MIIWWYIHTATLYQFSCRWTRDDIYTWWYIHSVTLYQLFCRWTRDDIYILQLFIKFLADEHVMIYIYIPQLYINFPADEHLMIYTYGNLISTFLQMNTWWYIHTVTLYQLSCRWTRDDIYIPQFYFNFPADEHAMIYTYRNFILIFLQMNTWWYIHSVTLYQLSCRWTRDDIYILQLYINFLTDEHVIIYIHTSTLYQLSCRWTRDDIYIP